MYKQELEFACAVVEEACTLTRRVQREVVANADALTKGDRTPVTLADLTVQAVIGHRIADRFPGDAFLAEEDSGSLGASSTMSAKVRELARSAIDALDEAAITEALDRGGHPGGAAGRHWVLDPVDGTKGFLRGQQYAIALALVDSGEVVVGALGCPNLPDPGVRGNGDGWIFHATRGGGSWALPTSGGEPVAARVDSIDDPSRAVVCESVEAAHAAHSVQAGIARRLGIVAEPYRIDSQCKYAVLARGEASIYLRLPRDESYREKVWDHAAGAIVIEEAGGRVSDLDGNPLDFSAGRRLATGRGIIATNGLLHDRVLQACRDELSS
jgi:3'(2'), 5'-bisphosphate nucleotidase